MNTSSICSNFDDLHTLSVKIDVKFNINGTTETRLKKPSIRNTNIGLNRSKKSSHPPAKSKIHNIYFQFKKKNKKKTHTQEDKKQKKLKENREYMWKI